MSLIQQVQFLPWISLRKRGTREASTKLRSVMTSRVIRLSFIISSFSKEISPITHLFHEAQKSFPVTSEKEVLWRIPKENIIRRAERTHAGAQLSATTEFTVDFNITFPRYKARHVMRRIRFVLTPCTQSNLFLGRISLSYFKIVTFHLIYKIGRWYLTLFWYYR